LSNSSYATAATPSGLFGIFTNRKISTKILIGFAIVLALTAVISAMSYLGFGKVSTGFDTFRQRVTVVGIARDVDREFVALRRYVREFSVSGDETLIEPTLKQGKVVTARIGEGLSEIKNPERHKMMVEVGEQFEKYSKDFDKLIALKQEQNKLTKEVLDPIQLDQDQLELVVIVSHQ
jgi:methyl-accepting chemotaxis protein